MNPEPRTLQLRTPYTMKNYNRPTIRKVTIDKEISMVMMSPPTEPGVRIMPKGLNMLRWMR